MCTAVEVLPQVWHGAVDAYCSGKEELGCGGLLPVYVRFRVWCSFLRLTHLLDGPDERLS